MALIAIHGLAGAALAVSQLPGVLKALLLVPLAFSVVQGLRSHAWRVAADAVVALTLSREGPIELTYRDGRRLDVSLDPSSTVLYRLMALRLRHDRGTLSLFLLPDMLDSDAWRRLSVWLRAAKTGD